MAFTKATELKVRNHVKMLVYGKAGTGKTTLSLSAPRPAIIDFDNGLHRVNHNHRYDALHLEPQNWQEVLDTMRDDLSEIDTIIIDTIGKMMDYIITHVCGTRQPQLKDWGRINAEYKNFCRILDSLGKNIIFLAHDSTRKEGDDNVFIPALREKNYTDIITELDLLGFVEMKADHGVQYRTVTFDPTSRNDGKNTCNLPGLMTIPNIIDKNGNCTAPNDFITKKIIEPYIANQKQSQADIAKYRELIGMIRMDVDSICDAESANDFVSSVRTRYEHVGNSLTEASVMMRDKAKELGLVLKGGKYVAA